MRSCVCRVLLAGISLVFAGCAAMDAEEGPDGPEARSQAEMVLDLRLIHLEDRLNAVETAVGELRGHLGTAGAKRPAGAGSPISAAPSSPPAPAPREAPASSGPAPAQGSTRTFSPTASPALPGGRPVIPGPYPAKRDTAPPQAAPRNPAAGAEQSAYDAALQLYERHQPNAAQENFQNFLRLYPDSPLAPNALYWLGESHYAAGKMDLAIMQFKKVAETYPRHPKAAAALLKAGYAYAQLGDRENARFYWQILLDDFPDSAPAALARKRLGEP